MGAGQGLGCVQQTWCSHDASAVVGFVLMTVRCLVLVKGTGWQVKSELLAEIEASNQLKSLILAQIERWRHALHMQVERGEGATPHLVANG